jgi:hypothetical protein
VIVRIRSWLFRRSESGNLSFILVFSKEVTFGFGDLNLMTLSSNAVS